MEVLISIAMGALAGLLARSVPAGKGRGGLIGNMIVGATGAAVAGVLLAAPASAAPNWIGQTGLLRTPTADSLGAETGNAGVHFIPDRSTAITGNWALIRNLEVGGLALLPRRGDTRVTALAKYTLIPETERGIGLAVGWWDIFDQIDQTVYAVASKGLGSLGRYPVRVHLGGGSGIYNGLFAGGDIALSRNLLGMVEYDGADMNGGIRYGLPSGIRLDLGWVNSKLGVGASINRGF